MTRFSRRARFAVGLAAVFVAAIWAFLLIWAAVPAALLGWHSTALTSDSMAPGLRAGDVVVSSPEVGTDLGPGTVVLFSDELGLVTHRIVEVRPDGSYITKGDSNARPDSTPVTPEEIIGVGRVRIPLVALPLVWFYGRDWLKLGLWLVAAGAVLWTSAWAAGGPRSALFGRYRGRHERISLPRSAVPASRSGVLSIGFGLLILTILGSHARAAFTDVTSNSGNSLAAASSFGFVGYLHNNPTPPSGDTASQAVLPFDGALPTGGTLYNYDTDRDNKVGLLLDRSSLGLGETDPTKYQIWSMPVPSDLTLAGPSDLTIWSAMKNFNSTMRGVVLVGLLDCDSGGGNCTTIATGALDLDPWSGGSSSWVSRTIDLGTVSYTVSAGRTLRAKVVVDDNSGQSMWFAYDTSAYASVLTVGP